MLEYSVVWRGDVLYQSRSDGDAKAFWLGFGEPDAEILVTGKVSLKLSPDTASKRRKPLELTLRKRR